MEQVCSLSPVLFNIFLENVMKETLQDVNTTISIGGSPIGNLRFAEDIDLIGGSEIELQDFTSRLEENAMGWKSVQGKTKYLPTRTFPLTS